MTNIYWLLLENKLLPTINVTFLGCDTGNFHTFTWSLFISRKISFYYYDALSLLSMIGPYHIFNNKFRNHM
jgi:hypothetical protein